MSSEECKIQTGDSLKVKQVLDDAVREALENSGYASNFYWENVKLVIMVAACISAMVAQFYPMPFPDSRALLAVCCVLYFLLSACFEYVVMFVDKDIIMRIKESTDYPALVVRGDFPRFQETYTLTIHNTIEPSNKTTGLMYVGRYFTEEGVFQPACFASDVQATMAAFQKNKYEEIQYGGPASSKKQD